MGKPMQVTRETLDKVAQAPSIRRALRQRAALLLPRAQREAAKAGRLELAKRLQVVEGVRPGTKAGGFRRPYARVTAYYPKNARVADAGARLSPRVILRRASQ